MGGGLSRLTTVFFSSRLIREDSFFFHTRVQHLSRTFAFIKWRQHLVAHYAASVDNRYYQGRSFDQQFHAELGEQNPFVEVFLEDEGGDEATAAVLQSAGDAAYADQGKLFERAAREVGDYVKRLE
jgi:hypothetical protein